MSIVGSAAIRPGFPKAKINLTSREYTVQYQVLTNTLADGPQVVSTASGLPALYSTYAVGNDSDSEAYFRDAPTIERLDDRSYYWVVECVFTTATEKETGNRGGGEGTHTDTAGQNADKTLELPTLKFAPVPREVPIERIYNTDTGFFNPPRNSACQVFNPPIMREECYLAMTIGRNEPISNPHPALSLTYQLAVNSDSFLGFAAGLVQCRTITPERMKHGATFYWRVEYLFWIRAEGWVKKVLDSGDYYCESAGGGSGTGSNYCELPDGTFAPCGASGSGTAGCPDCARKIAFIDDKHHPRKGLLNGRGGKLDDGASPIYITLRPYPSLPFSVLGLPGSLAGYQ